MILGPAIGVVRLDPSLIHGCAAAVGIAAGGAP